MGSRGSIGFAHDLTLSDIEYSISQKNEVIDTGCLTLTLSTSLKQFHLMHPLRTIALALLSEIYLPSTCDANS